MKRKQLIVSATALGLFPLASLSYAAVTLYTDAAAWQSATGGVSFVETFSDEATECGLSFISDVGSVSGGRFNDRVTRGNGESTTFQWAVPVDAVGAEWDLSPGGPGQGLALTAEIHAGGYISIFEIPNTTVGGFVGFVSDDPIDKLVISAGTQSGVAETYRMDNLAWTEAAKTVSVDDCDTGIGNRLTGACSLNHDVTLLARACEQQADNHGQYVSCVTQGLTPMMASGLISGREKGAITSCAARSSGGKAD